MATGLFNQPITSSSLDVIETAVEPVACSPPPLSVAEHIRSCSHFRHSGWTNDRVRVYHALRRAGFSGSRVTDFAHCGEGAWFYSDSDNPGVYHVTRDYCRNRWCRPCAAARASVIRENMVQHLPKWPMRFVTLTLQANSDGLDARIAALYKAFRRLRSYQNWKDRVRGGMFVLEVKWNAEAGHWHPHLHLLTTGTFYDQADLSHDWLRATGDSRIVHIRLVRGQEAAANYLTKYMTKTVDQSVMHDEDRLVEAMIALRGKRLIGTFGGWKSKQFLHTPPQFTGTRIGHLAEIRLQADSGDALAVELLRAYESMPSTVGWQAITPTIGAPSG